MKRILLSVFTLFSLSGIAQLNLDLEAWTVKTSGSDSADYWLNPADAVAYGAPQNLFQETASVAQGSAAAHITTVYWAAGAFLGLDTLPGAILQQVAYTQKPASISFAYKSNPMAGDYNIVAAQLTHWDNVNNTQVIDAEAVFTTNTVNNTWTSQIVNFTYYTTDTPDTLTLVATSSANILFGDGSYGYAKIGSELWIDDIAINFTTGVEYSLAFEELKIYPNPVATELTIVNPSENPLKIQVYDITGRLLLTKKLLKGKNTIPVENFPEGIYIYKILNFSNQAVKTGKITKQ